MTREEMEELKGLAASMGLYDDRKPCKRAVILGKAIKALEQEPCEDCVSRQAVLDIVNNPLNIRLDEIVKKLPPVTPERPKGEWIRVDNTKCKCSKCEVIHMIAQYPAGHIDWCPNCGADMREVSG